MEHFWRSVRYVLPYRGRLIASVFFVLMISVLWAGGFAAMIPGMKILMSDEGLHGWADQEMVESRLRAKLAKQQVIEALDGKRMPYVARVVKLEKDSPLGKAGVRENEWIIGVGAAPADYDSTLQQLASQAGEATWSLRVFDPNAPQTPARVVAVSLARPSPTARGLSIVSSRIARPRSLPERMPMFVGLLVLGVVVTVLREGARFCQEYLTTSAILEGLTKLRCETYQAVLRMPVGYFSSQGTTDAMSRFVQDSGEIARGLETLLGKTLVEPGKLAGMFGLALWMNWQLTLLACTTGPLAYFLIRRLAKLMKRATKKALQGWSSMLAVLEETLLGLRVVKGYTMEPAENQRFEEVNRKLYHQQRRMAAIEAATSPSVEALGIIAAMGAAGVAGYMVFNGIMKVDAFVGLMVALAGMFDPVRKLSQVSTRFHRADAAGARVFELHDQQPEPERPNAPDLPRHAQSIEFRHVCFTYPNSARPALANINLRIGQGENVAIVGANGSGKTTLLSLVPRFFTPQEGCVLIDGTDLADVSLRSLRRQIGIVTQETVLFHATVAENIAYGIDQCPRAAIEAAARQAFVDEFVQQMPEGYETMVGEHGATLSGGQRQRIAIARAILRNPAILIFDEAMSQIDSESESKIYQAIETFMAGRTTLMIAHRFSTVINADRVVVMVGGGIVDVGRHEELLKRCEAYRTLFETQLVGAK